MGQTLKQEVRLLFRQLKKQGKNDEAALVRYLLVLGEVDLERDSECLADLRKKLKRLGCYMPYDTVYLTPALGVKD